MVNNKTFFDMRFRILLWLALITLWAVAQPDHGDTCSPSPQPYAQLGKQPYQYHGPLDHETKPIPAEIRVGIFVPSRGLRYENGGRQMLEGAALAVDEANKLGGHQGHPFVLVLGNDQDIWGSAHQVVRLVYEDQVWGILGSLGGQSSHIAQQIITKARMPLICPASMDASLTQINIPWTFRLMPDTKRFADLLSTHLYHHNSQKRVGVICDNFYDHRLGLKAFARAATLRHAYPLQIVECFSGDKAAILSSFKETGIECALIWSAGASATDWIQAALTVEAGFPLIGGPSWADPETLLAIHRLNPKTQIASPFATTTHHALWHRFCLEYKKRVRETPGIHAAYAYDGMSLLIQAINNVGLNRAKIQMELAATKNYLGVTGSIQFDGTGANTASPVLISAPQE